MPMAGRHSGILLTGVMGHLPRKLLFKEFDILSGNPQGFSNFVCGNFFGPDGPINCFRIHLQGFGHFGYRQKFRCNIYLKTDPPVSEKRFRMPALTRPYPLRDLVRKCITPSRFRTQQMLAEITRRLQNQLAIRLFLFAQDKK